MHHCSTTEDAMRTDYEPIGPGCRQTRYCGSSHGDGNHAVLSTLISPNTTGKAIVIDSLLEMPKCSKRAVVWLRPATAPAGCTRRCHQRTEIFCFQLAFHSTSIPLRFSTREQLTPTQPCLATAPTHPQH